MDGEVVATGKVLVAVEIEENIKQEFKSEVGAEVEVMEEDDVAM